MSDSEQALEGPFIAYRTIDRILTGEGIADARTTKIISAFQQAAANDLSVSHEIALALLEGIHRPVAIFTGFVIPERFPQGENDGPLGAAALGRALQRAGFQTTLLVDAPLLDTARWIAAEIHADLPVQPITPKVLESQGQGSIAIAVEKPGWNEMGELHSYDGLRIENGSTPIDSLFRAMNARGETTISIADRGNEVGFGQLRELVYDLIPASRRCSCGCGGGIAAATPAQFLLPAAVSNWGAYGLCAALALLTRDPSLTLLPSEEARMLNVAAVRGCRDGILRVGAFGVDGVPGPASVGLVARLHSLVRDVLGVEE